ncbi:Conserved oligomeric Golgi complex subunit 2 [Araneus ventricosus]|uniref:Conserved oligomeric Golgi complex subunit 2 n=1 Tax=Araneus ventricosus TaxID=182803 RepID=A0A4Y2DM90_ARAVE|nr:Conserved oligomeric Golgi complex subunit 2 [Araneus ventricosus]
MLRPQPNPSHSRYDLSSEWKEVSNQTDDIDSDNEDVILVDLKEKWKTVEGNGRITDDVTLSDFLEVDAELLTASYPTDEEILNSLMDNNKDQESDSNSENEDVIQPKPHRTEMLQSFETIKRVGQKDLLYGLFPFEANFTLWYISFVFQSRRMSENTIDKHLKVKSMPSLCFNKDDFVSNEFSVDKFVSECRKYASLDTMRDDLNISHKILCTAMIELLNKDYADFVNLSSNLAGLDKSIKSLTLPLQSLKNEIEVTKENLDSTLLSVTNMFHERALVHYSKVLIHHLLIIEEGLEKINLLYINGEDNHNFEDIEILERIAIVFNNVQFHMQFFKKIVDCKNYSIKEEVVSSVAKNLEQQLQAVFLQSLSDDMHKQDLHKILRIYSYISEENKVEGIFRASVVRPAMKNLITQSNITKLGLEKVLNGILNFIPNSCNDVLKMTRRTNNDSEIVPGYDFLVNAVWLEIIDAFEYVAPVYLYSLGDPQQFHQNYCSFMMFLDEFEHICGNQTSVSKLREQSSYKEFIQKFNLDVYFQIRFQEIAGTFEHILFEESLIKETNRETDLPYSLKATVSLLSCINLCWSDSVYLPFLKKDFWRLTIQLIFRYNKYIHCCLKNIKEETFELALLIKDVETLVPELQTFLLETVEKKLECESFHRIVEAAVEEIVEFLNEIPAVAAKLIVKILVEKCTSHLKLIASIPQRFRKTNREIPSKPSPYVSLVLTSLTEFSVGTKSILPAKWCKYCELEVTDEIMKQCVTLMQDVLTSIKKMEDSLKILKRARDKPIQNTGQFSAGAVTDDDKIRRQLAIDVTYFEELVSV